jgi:DHA2 family multidrug resistance protein
VALAAHVSALDPQYVQTFQNLSQRFGGDAAGQQQANGLIGSLVQQQASMLSYLDVFQLLGIGVLLIVPLVFLLKRGEPGAAPPEGAH